MPFCPQCVSEYRDGFTRCKDCDVMLVAERPAAPARVADHDHHEAAVVPAPTGMLFPAKAMAAHNYTGSSPAGSSGNLDDEENPEGFLVEGDRAWIYSAHTGAEAWFLRRLLEQRGIESDLEYLGPDHPSPFRLMVARDRGPDAMASLDAVLGTHPCAHCGEPGPEVGRAVAFCLACGNKA